MSLCFAVVCCFFFFFVSLLQFVTGAAQSARSRQAVAARGEQRAASRDPRAAEALVAAQDDVVV